MRNAECGMRNYGQSSNVRLTPRSLRYVRKAHFGRDDGVSGMALLCFLYIDKIECKNVLQFYIEKQTTHTSIISSVARNSIVINICIYDPLFPKKSKKIPTERKIRRNKEKAL